MRLQLPQKLKNKCMIQLIYLLIDQLVGTLTDFITGTVHHCIGGSETLLLVTMTGTLIDRARIFDILALAHCRHRSNVRRQDHKSIVFGLGIRDYLND